LLVNLAVDQIVAQADSNVLSIPYCPERRVARNVAFSVKAIEIVKDVMRLVQLFGVSVWRPKVGYVRLPGGD
jgi:hypothetical protein